MFLRPRLHHRCACVSKDTPASQMRMRMCFYGHSCVCANAALEAELSSLCLGMDPASPVLRVTKKILKRSGLPNPEERKRKARHDLCLFSVALQPLQGATWIHKGSQSHRPCLPHRLSTGQRSGHLGYPFHFKVSETAPGSGQLGQPRDTDIRMD